MDHHEKYLALPPETHVLLNGRRTTCITTVAVDSQLVKIALNPITTTCGSLRAGTQLIGQDDLLIVGNPKAKGIGSTAGVPAVAGPVI